MVNHFEDINVFCSLYPSTRTAPRIQWLLDYSGQVALAGSQVWLRSNIVNTKHFLLELKKECTGALTIFNGCQIWNDGSCRPQSSSARRHRPSSYHTFPSHYYLPEVLYSPSVYAPVVGVGTGTGGGVECSCQSETWTPALLSPFIESCWTDQVWALNTTLFTMAIGPHMAWVVVH